MPELQRLRADHAPAVLSFELANRAYFATFISDRGDEFFDHFTEQYNALLAEQEAGTCVFHVLVGEDGTVLGWPVQPVRTQGRHGRTRVPGRAARSRAAASATATVRELSSGFAAAQYGLHTLRAATNHDNVASQKVLAKAGFVPGWPGRARRASPAPGVISVT